MSNIIVMAFSPRNIVGYFLKKGLQRGGHAHPRTSPLATPLKLQLRATKIALSCCDKNRPCKRALNGPLGNDFVDNCFLFYFEDETIFEQIIQKTAKGIGR